MGRFRIITAAVASLAALLALAPPSSASAAVTVPPFRSLEQFVDQQFRDFAGRPATAAEQAAWAKAITAADPEDRGAVASDRVARLVDHPNWGPIQSPAIRLYFAYFTRWPDEEGLTYWSNRRRFGARVADISQHFARSNEFQRRYGTLADVDFVRRVYLNVQGRTGDIKGVDYWRRQLASGAKNRGQVMVAFSESSEFTRRLGKWVQLINVYTGMVRRIPTQPEIAAWVNQPSVAAIEHLLGSAEYAARIP